MVVAAGEECEPPSHFLGTLLALEFWGIKLMYATMGNIGFRGVPGAIPRGNTRTNDPSMREEGLEPL